MICNLGNRIVNNYIIPCDEGYILIDTGYESGFRRFQRKLMESGIQPEDPVMIYPAHGKQFKTSDLQKYIQSLDHVKLHPL